jgi:penicillin-binding protein 1A
VRALALEQRPVAQAALVALEPASGAVRALVGGFDFAASEYDRAMQARRQTGSAFKPFVFAAALAGDRTLADLLLDERPYSSTARTPSRTSRELHERVLRALDPAQRARKSANIATVNS